VPAPPGTVDLASGAPDPDLLPRLGPRLRRVAGTLADAVGYATSGPRPELVALARERLIADGGPGRDAAFTVTSGALDAIERLLTAHLRPGDRVAVEDPCWANLIDLLAALGLEAVGVPVDDDGPTTDGLRAAIGAGVAAVVVTSRAHNPTGGAVSPARAAALRGLLAAAPDVLVIEDDHAAELAEVSLAALAGAGRAWAFVRSVSKPYGPDLRVAVVAGDEASIARVEGRMRLGAGWVSTVLQRTVVELWRDEAVAATVARARDEYARRRHGLVTALRKRGVAARGRTGINVWVPVADEPSTISALRDRGWAVAPGALYRLASEAGIRLTVGAVRPSEVEGLADAVAAAVGTAAAPGGTAR
jgi:DNA-binding transcriptional MocR family regulator